MNVRRNIQVTAPLQDPSGGSRAKLATSIYQSGRQRTDLLTNESSIKAFARNDRGASALKINGERSVRVSAPYYVCVLSASPIASRFQVQ